MTTLPPSVSALLTDFLQESQRLMYHEHRSILGVRWFTWELQEGVRLYDLDTNEERSQESCAKALRRDALEWVGIQVDDFWRPIAYGIPPEGYGGPDEGEPQRYEIRDCIEVWPTPHNSEMLLRVKARADLSAFTLDTDTTTIDADVVFFHALGSAKAHYQQSDAELYFAKALDRIMQIASGGHANQRYIPGEAAPRNATPPRFLPVSP
jgi:hypothetical protein